MYHRVCARTEDTACYFERGTAVTPEAFRAQLRWLAERYVFRTVRDLVFGERNEHPTVALTFDDGYRDVVEHVFPVCRELGAVATVYVCTSTLPPGADPLWFDRYYAMVPQLQAGFEATAVRDILATECNERPPDSSLRWWVRGPLKARLAGLARDARGRLLERLEAALGVSSVPSASIGYLDRQDLSSLMSVGWEIGGHGAHHDRLTDLHPTTLAAELSASSQMLVELGQRKPRTIAYPDGALDQRVVAAAAAWFEAGVTVSSELFDSTHPQLRLPRLLCRGEGEVPHPSLMR